jgi:hypothetical protein
VDVSPASMRAVSGGRHVAFACVLWPSRKFAETPGLPERLDLLRDLVPEHRRTIDAAAELVPALAARSTARTGVAEHAHPAAGRRELRVAPGRAAQPAGRPVRARPHRRPRHEIAHALSSAIAAS